LDDAKEVKKIEKTTNHDVKAVEYFLQNKFQANDIPEKYRNFIHFALTSYDTNGIANPLLFKGAIENVYMPTYEALVDQLKEFAEKYKDTPMLAHTH
jgi:adenylosuccinate lyase